MRIVPFQDIFLQRLFRQEVIPGLQIHANGYAIHWQPISPIFQDYFLPLSGPEATFKTNILYDRPLDPFITPLDQEKYEEEQNFILMELFLAHSAAGFAPNILGLNNVISPYFLKSKYEETNSLINEIKTLSGKHTYTYINLHSNLLTSENLALLKDWGIKEIRTNTVNLDNVQGAHEMGFIVTVESMSHPNARKDLFELLPKIQNKIDHLVLKEIRVTKNNQERLQEFYPDYKIYKDTFYYVYDEGLAYDVMEEAINQNYSYSVFDFNSAVERLICPFHSGGPIFNFLTNNENLFICT